MKKEDYRIHIVGAGVSGLVAAQVLELQGYRPVILEASNSVGGRVKTQIVDGYQLDQGFQVLLEAYPMAKKYLDFNQLDLQKLLPGAVVFKNGRSMAIGDPIRDFNFIWSTLIADVGTLADKVRIFNLNKQLKSRSIESIFSSKEVSTLEYLEDLGFSSKMIETFFKPFFSGIFLEDELKTSSRMFQFVYKMFGEGLAVVPKDGIGAISDQLKLKLKNTSIQFGAKVASVGDSEILLDDGVKLATHFTLIATDPGNLISNLKSQNVQWHSCTNLYFKIPKRSIEKALIGLIADKNAFINNIFFSSSLDMEHKGNQELLSVTVVKDHSFDDKELIEIIKTELDSYCGITGIEFLHLFHIPKALPQLNELQYDISPETTKLKSTIFLAGDYLLNSSLNAAMISGERAAQGIIKSLEDGLVVENLTSEYL
ncbi:FAD-dependent oxidoreductase [Winogradskyella aurantiaca]|uniref:FAD-dependent oxidoreductase n=1 Tax=Winogradskyella aurantiaca TaxID=2219558 RepID=UPI000E1CD8B3|nr:FAD-dependent oxidoreductase [Winogradskyella aurantiaca]